MPGAGRRGCRRREETTGPEPVEGTELALEMLEQALELGHLKAGWVAADDAFGMSPSFRDGLAALGMRYVLDVPGGTTVWPLEPAWTSPEYQGNGRPRKPKLRDGQRRTMEQRSDELPDEAWQEITVAQGSQGPRSYQFSAQRVRPTAKRRPGESTGQSGAGTWTAANLATTCPTPRRTLPWRPWLMWAVPGGALRPNSRRRRATWGLDEYETRTWAGWHHHIALCLLAGRSC